MTVFYPDGVGSQGYDTWLFVPTISSKAAMTVAEATATGACQLQNAMRPGFGPSSDTERLNDERQGSSIVYDALGTTKITLPDMVLIDRPQDAAAAATRKHLDVLSEGATGFLIERRGVGSSQENWVAPAAGQKYTGYPVKVGPQVELAPGDSKVFETSVSFAVTGAKFKGTIAA